MSQRLNILYLHSHDTGRYIQPFGHAIDTPRLAQLAREGMLFRRAFCASPSCSASRSGLLTGQASHSSGMLGLAHRGFKLHDPTQHLAHFLRTAGYETALAGIQHESRQPDALGYERVLTTDQKQVLAAVDGFLTGRANQKPFFLSVGFFETHRPFPTPDARDDPRYTLPPPPLPDTPETRQDMACFKTMARTLDEKMGHVLDAIERAGLASNTLVICTTDHGIAFPRMKANLTEAGTGVFLIMRSPSGFTDGKSTDALVSQIDLYPTICELLNLPAPKWLQGVSLMPLARDPAASVRRYVHTGVTFHAAYEPQRSVRTERWSYIRRFDAPAQPVLPNCDNGQSKSYLINHGWREQTLASESLYDLAFDPCECNNVAGDPRHRAVLEEMRGELQRWMRDTADPLLRGTVAPVEGAKVSDPAALNPEDLLQPS